MDDITKAYKQELDKLDKIARLKRARAKRRAVSVGLMLTAALSFVLAAFWGLGTIGGLLALTVVALIVGIGLYPD